jgi:hypothetical protein
VNTLPPSLVRFESQLEHAIRRRSRRSRRPLRAAVAAAAAAAIALGVLSALPGSGPSVVERAAAALTASNGTILHVVMRSDKLELETWQETSPPYHMRQIMVSNGRRLEVATLNGVPQIYDEQTNTIYTGSALKRPASRPTKEQGAQPYGGDPYREKILALLNSGNAHEDGRTVVDSRDAVRIVSDDGAMTLLVDAGTYEPIEWSVTTDSTTTTTRFPTYEHLPATEANAGLLSLTAEHPGATVDTDPAHFDAAMQRLSPKGG